MENIIKFLEEKITDKMQVEGIVDVFEQMCSTPLEEDMVLFETGTFTDFSKEPYVSFDDKRRVVDLMITTVAATSDSLNITWKI